MSRDFSEKFLTFMDKEVHFQQELCRFQDGYGLRLEDAAVIMQFVGKFGIRIFQENTARHLA